MQWWDQYAPTKKIDPRLLYAVPNGGLRNKVVAAKLKAEGVRKGVLDMILDVPNDVFHGLRIELKAKDGAATKDQIEFADLLRRRGYNAVFSYGADEAILAIRGYLGDRRL